MAKTATFGVLHLMTSFTVTYTLTGSVTIAGLVTFVEPLVNTVMHYFFDKHWDHPRAQHVRRATARLLGGIATRLSPDAPKDHFSTKARSIT
jgi:uncharacterized membrane protein